MMFSIRKLKASCDDEWKAYYEAFDYRNHMYQSARKEEAAFNECVFKKLVSGEHLYLNEDDLVAKPAAFLTRDWRSRFRGRLRALFLFTSAKSSCYTDIVAWDCTNELDGRFSGLF